MNRKSWINAASLPPDIAMTEVCPRDGFQNISTWIPTEIKTQSIDLLIDAGLKRLEITSFVNPKAIPQMADAGQVVAHVLQRNTRENLGLDIVALVPNLRGAQDAWHAGVRHISYVISASEQHNQANIKRTHADSLAELSAITTARPDMHVTLSMATVFGCPFAGAVSVDTVLRLLSEAVSRGIKDVTLCDTIGVASPVQTGELLSRVRNIHPLLDIGLHLHDTHGMALANTLVALTHGIRRLETAAGGLGGCPFAPGAAGNCATEDTVNMLWRMGVQTGIDQEKLLHAVAFIRQHLQTGITSHLSQARCYREFNFQTGNLCDE